MAYVVVKSFPFKALRALYRRARAAAVHIERAIAGTDRQIITDYLSTHDVRCLHIGCGAHFIEGFLNADLSSSSKRVLRLDATKTFPFHSESFDYIFSEHMIEHIPYVAGLQMLSECRRILKKGGRIRISTPSLESVIALGGSDLTDLQSSYIGWSVGQFTSFAPGDDPAFVINNFFRAWGHQFIYARRTLATSLEQTGFADVKACRLNESDAPMLSSLENEGRMPPGFLALETFTLEATSLP